MSTFEELSLASLSKKIVLVELDVGQEQDFFTNYSPYTWYWDLTDTYTDITSFKPNHGTSSIENIGSVKQDGVSLTEVTSIVNTESTEGSFYWDSANRILYIHCIDHNEPSLYDIFVGVVFGFSNIAKYYNNVFYEPRLLSVPSITRARDPLFFGKLQFSGGNVTIDNNDGEYDSFADDNDLFGNAARILLGFDDLAYTEFEDIYNGFIENVSISSANMTVEINDQRKQLSRSIPVNVFDTTTYPDLADSNINKIIPLGFGTIYNAPVVCTNEEESPTPTNYDFKICDTTDREIKSIDTVYVNGVTVTPASTDLTDATFVITSASGDYTPGDDVTVDFTGYKDDDGDLIENGLDVILEILMMFTTLVYNNDLFNVAQWNSETVKAKDIGLWIDSSKEINKIIEDISFTLQGIYYNQRDGKIYFKTFDSSFPSLQEITISEILDSSQSLRYDPVEILTNVEVGYKKDWADNRYTILVDNTHETENFLIFKTYKFKRFNTLLTTSADAQLYSDDVFTRFGNVEKIVNVKIKMQAIKRELGDFIDIPIVARATGETIGIAKSEIISINYDLNNIEMNIECKIVSIQGPQVAQDSSEWDGTLWDGDVWSESKFIDV